MKLETICWSYFELSDCLLLQVGVVVVVSSYADDNVLFVVNLCCDGTEEVPLSTMLYALLFFLSDYTPFGRNQVFFDHPV